MLSLVCFIPYCHLTTHGPQKLPGLNASSSEAHRRLDKYKAARPEVFNSRDLWVAVQRMFETLSFKLSWRRFVTKLFSEAARSKYETR